MNTCFGKDKDKGPEIHPVLLPPRDCLVVASLSVAYAIICTVLSFTLAFWVVVPVVLVLCVLAEGPVARKYPSAGWLVGIGVFTIFVSMSIGITNYHTNMEPFWYEKLGRTYVDVSADAMASAHLDGGTISFNKDVMLDNSRALGLRRADYTYCVAPILSQHKTHSPVGANPTVHFWAVGADCCAARGVFTCDGAGEVDVHTGVVVHDREEGNMNAIFHPRDSYDSYLTAIQAAGELYGLTVAEPPLLLRWAADPKHLSEGWLTAAVLTALFTWILFTVMIAAFWCSIDQYYDDKVRRAVSAAMAHQARNYGGQGNAPGHRQGGQPSDGGRQIWDPFMLSSKGP